jgi:peptide/nickel transport system substrate-binding protein
MHSTAAAALLPLLGGALPALAQDTSNLVVRVDLDIGNLDPANRGNSCDEAILRATMQGLVTFKPSSLDWELDAAKSITQVSDTEITFELNPGQMFSDGHGEMTPCPPSRAISRRWTRSRSRARIPAASS